jgi:hypothetical protein
VNDKTAPKQQIVNLLVLLIVGVASEDQELEPEPTPSYRRPRDSTMSTLSPKI